jgi:hypothetical protein
MDTFMTTRTRFFGDLIDEVLHVGRTNYEAIAGLLLQEDQVERPEHEDNSDVRYQPLPEPVPQEQDVPADHDDYQHEHVKQDDCLMSHSSLLLRDAEAVACKAVYARSATTLKIPLAKTGSENMQHFCEGGCWSFDHP